MRWERNEDRRWGESGQVSLRSWGKSGGHTRNLLEVRFGALTSRRGEVARRRYRGTRAEPRGQGQMVGNDL